MEILWDNIAPCPHMDRTHLLYIPAALIFTPALTSRNILPKKWQVWASSIIKNPTWKMQWQKLKITEMCGLYCTQQLVGVNRNEHATLSAQRGLKTLAANREAGHVPVLSGDWGSSGMWDSHHLASFTPISPENQPWPHLKRSVCACVFICALVSSMSGCVKDTMLWRETKSVCEAGWGEENEQRGGVWTEALAMFCDGEHPVCSSLCTCHILLFNFINKSKWTTVTVLGKIDTALNTLCNRALWNDPICGPTCITYITL